MVYQLIPIVIGIDVSIVVVVALFSILPTLMGTFSCPDPDSFNDTSAQQWAQSCEDLKSQTAVVPVLITLSIVISAILLVTRLFGG